MLRQTVCLTCLLVGMICTHGCRAIRVVQSVGQKRWSCLDASLVLPAGSWEVEEVVPGIVSVFREKQTSRSFVLMRLRARKHEPPWLPLRRLFVNFKKKREIARWQCGLESGDVAECAEYLADVEGRELSVTACVVRRGRRMYEVASWCLKGRKPAPECTAGEIVKHLRFADGRKGGPP